MPRPRLLLADDHAGTSALLRGLLQVEFDVIADVADGRALVKATEDLAPDVVVTDIGMPGLDGIAATRAILGSNPTARVVLVTVDSDPLTIERGLAAGALGYVLKMQAGDDLIPAVRAALRDERLVSRPVRVSGTGTTPRRPPSE